MKLKNTRKRKQVMMYGSNFRIPPPPSFAPNVIIPNHSKNIQKAATYEILNQYLLSNIYVWLKDTGKSFWMYPVRINKNIIYGYVWKNHKWNYTYIYLHKINFFY